MSAQSRAGSIASVRRSSGAGSRQASTAGGVVGLPGAGDAFLDEFIDPSLWDPNKDFFDAFLNGDTFDLTEANTADMSSNAYDANQFQSTDLPQQYLEQNFENGLGFTFLTPKDGQQYASNQAIAPYDEKIETSQAQYDPAPIGSTSNLAYESANKYPVFAPWDVNDLPPPLPTDTTPGLSAIPGGSSFPSQPTYPDPSNAMNPAGPYFNPAMQYNGYFPGMIPSYFKQPQDNLQEQQIHAVAEPRLFSYKAEGANTKPKPTHDQSDSDSDTEVPLAKRPRQAQPIKRGPASQPDEPRRNSTVSDNSSLGKPLKVAVVRAGEKPKKCDDKSWVRINNTTKGETTRTARINHFAEEGTKYKVKPLPIGDWETRKFKFEYAHHNGMDEFKKRTMSARQIHEYILEHPGDLRIWIQVTPGDSARRYASKAHSECIFEQCPNRQWANKGTIEVGTYRVAFDEKCKTYDKGAVDPFDCVAYAHLYCVERFLDFHGICQVADVKVDTRGEMPREPKGVAAFTFSGKHINERALADKFIKAAKAGQLDRTPEFSNYPVHTEYRKGEPKPHQHTLVAAMFNVNWEHRTRSQLKQFVYRNIKPGSFGIHRGDQEIIVVDKKVESLKVFKKAKAAKRHKSFNHSAYYDEFHPEINIRIAECLALRAQFKAEDEAGVGPSRGGSKKRQLVVIDDSDDEIDFTRNDDDIEEIGDEYEQQKHAGFSQGLRSSPRKKQRINYAELQDVSQQRDVYNQIAQYVPAYHAPGLQHQGQYMGSSQVNPSSISPKARKSSCTDYFLPRDQARYNIDQAAQIDVSNMPPLSEQEIDWMLSLQRRKSSTLSIGPSSSIMKSPKLSRTLRSPQITRSSARTASFNAQPVTSSKEYNINDPPSQFAVSPDVTRAVFDHSQRGRRSARLASKTTSAVDKVQTGRVDKRRHK